MTTRKIAAAFKEQYDADVSPTLVSKVTDAVMAQVTEWKNRPLDAAYQIVYLYFIVLKVRQDSCVIYVSFTPLPCAVMQLEILFAQWRWRIPSRTIWPVLIIRKTSLR